MSLQFPDIETCHGTRKSGHETIISLIGKERVFLCLDRSEERKTLFDEIGAGLKWASGSLAANMKY